MSEYVYERWVELAEEYHESCGFSGYSWQEKLVINIRYYLWTLADMLVGRMI